MLGSIARPASLTGILLIAVFLLSLALIPPLFEPRRFTFPSSGGEAAKKSFPLDFSLPQVGASKKLNLRQLAASSPGGLIVNFWATWCPPCIEELPSLELLHRQLERGGGRLPKLVTISVDDIPADILALYKTLDFQPTFMALHDEDTAVARAAGSARFPETYYVSSKGEILHKWIGPQNWLSESVLHRISELNKI